MTHGAVRFLIRIIEAAILVALLTAAVLTWRLSQGALKIDVVAPYISSAFANIAPGFRFRIAGADFKWTGFSGAPELTVHDVRVLNESGAVIAGLPSMVVRLSLPALKRGIAAPEEVRLSNPIIRFVHRADGSMGLGVQGAATSGPPSTTVPANTTTPAASPTVATDNTSSNALAVSLIGALTRAPSNSNPAGYLNRVAIDGTTVVLVDEVSGQRWLVPDATMNFASAAGDIEIDASFPVVEEGKRWNFTAKGRYAAASETLKVDLNVDGFRPARVAGLAPQLKPFGMIDLRLSGTAAATFSLSKAGARLSDLQFDVKGQDGQIHMPAPVAKDYPVKVISLKGTAGADLDRITIDQARVELNHSGDIAPVITLTGEGKALNSTPAVDLNVSMAALSTSELKQYWPVGIKPNTRSWIDENLKNGGLYDTRFKLRLAGPDINALDATEARLSSELRGVTVRYMKGLPEVENTSGVLTIAGDEVRIDVTGGHVPDMLSGDGLSVPSGKVRMYGLAIGKERANIQLNIEGGFGDVMRLIDHPPLGYASQIGLDAAKAVGNANVALTLDFPLVKDLKLDQLQLGVKAKATNVGIPGIAFGLPLTEGDVALVLDRAGMDVTGNVVLGGIPSAITWRENFNSGDFKSHYVLDPVVNNAQRPLIGLSVIPFIPPYIDGAVPAHVVYTVKRDDTSRLEADVNLAPAAMAVPELGWRKEPGQAATAKIEAEFTNGKLDTVPAFRVTSGNDLDVSGSVTFADDGRMKLLTINPSVIGETKLSGDIGIDAGGGYTVSVAGPAFNSTYFWKELNRDDKRGKATNDSSFETLLRLHASFDRMWLTKTAEFTGVNLDFERDYTGIEKIELMSNVDGTTPFTFNLNSDKGARKFTGSSANGGSVMRAIGLYSDIVGGNLKINGELAADGTVNGMAEIKDFKLVQAPALARLLSVASLTGIVDELRGGGISFQTLRVPFSYANTTLTVRDGEMYGTSLGLTGRGTYSFASSIMNFDGTLIPAYTINSILSSIPLIGPILTGGEKGGGIFAATYSYRGDVATAEPSVNPLAAIMPGFLRHIFDIFKPAKAQEPVAPPASERPTDKSVDKPSVLP